MNSSHAYDKYHVSCVCVCVCTVHMSDYYIYMSFKIHRCNNLNRSSSAYTLYTLQCEDHPVCVS